MIKGYIITMVNNHESTLASRQVIGSIKQTKSEIDPLIFPATTPDTVQQDLKKITSIDAQWLKYSYPQVGEKYDIATGLRLRAYETGNIQNRIACMVSHMRLWQECIDLGDKIIILEHDALFTRQFIEEDIDKSHKWRGEVVGLNDPRGMTLSLIHI